MCHWIWNANKRVFDAIDDGLSKYKPNQRAKDFNMLIQMVEKMLGANETKENILK